MDLKSLSFLLLLGFLPLFCSSTSTVKPSSPITNGTSSTLAPTTEKPSPTCEALNSSCGDCTDNGKCYWCSSDSTCKEYPSSKIIPRDCAGNKWYWKQCFAPGYIVIIVIPSVCGVLLLAFGCCIYCCCCRSKGPSGYERESKRIRRRKEENRQRSEARRADRRVKTDAIRQKYGLLSNEDDNNEVV